MRLILMFFSLRRSFKLFRRSALFVALGVTEAVPHRNKEGLFLPFFPFFFRSSFFRVPFTERMCRDGTHYLKSDLITSLKEPLSCDVGLVRNKPNIRWQKVDLNSFNGTLLSLCVTNNTISYNAPYLRFM